MKIDEHMDLTELAEHMGGVTAEEARRMKRLLLDAPRARTEDFTGDEWTALLLQAARSEGT